MNSALQIIEQKLTSNDVRNRLAIALNLDPNDEASQNKTLKYTSSVLAEISKTAGDPKKDLTVCQPDSIVQAMIDAARYQLTIDGRQHAHLVKYGNKASFMPGYRAYLYQIKKHYPDADFTVECIFKGDDVKIWAEDGTQHFTIVKGSDPFTQTVSDFRGVLVAVNYTDGGRLIQKVMAVTKERIERARKAAKQDYIWSSDYFEKAKAAAIKNALKPLFTHLQGLQDMASADNEVNHDLDKQPASPARKSIVDNINSVVVGDPEPDETTDIIDVEYSEDVIIEDVPQPEIDVDTYIAQGDDAASKGVAKYKEWLETLSEDVKPHIRHKSKEWSKTALEADAEEDFAL